MNVAINGMGRIGRLLFRRLALLDDINLVAVNDIMPVENLVYLIRYDSVYGTFPGEITSSGEDFRVNDKNIRVFRADHPSALPWKELAIDIVLECAGRFTTQATAATHLQAGARKVLLSTTGSDDIPLLIWGVNQDSMTNNMDIISPGGCMTNCAAPLLKILNSMGLLSVQLNILHSYTSRQELVDAPHKQFRRGRAAAESIIPVEIDLHQSLERLFPQLTGRMACLSTRIPVANGAMADFSVQLAKPVKAIEINEALKHAAANEYHGILGYSEEELVSLDLKGNSHSMVIDAKLTSAVENHLKLIAWFDNEYGFTSRMIDWLNLLKKQID